MTIDARTTPRIGRLAACALVALGVWFVGIEALTIAVEPTSTVVIFGRSPQTVIDAAIASDVALLGVSGRVLTVTGTSPGFVRQLYAAGAWLVLPLSDGGCRGVARLSKS